MSTLPESLIAALQQQYDDLVPDAPSLVFGDDVVVVAAPGSEPPGAEPEPGEPLDVKVAIEESLLGNSGMLSVGSWLRSSGTSDETGRFGVLTFTEGATVIRLEIFGDNAIMEPGVRLVPQIRKPHTMLGLGPAIKKPGL